MASGYKDIWVTSWDTLRFNWWEDGQSIAENYTDVTWNITLISTSSGAISSSSSKSWNATVNGVYYEGTTTVGIGNNTSKRLAYGTTRIYHNADGSKEFSFSFNVYFGITFSNSWIGWINGSGSGTLTPIPRQANLTSAPDFTDAENPTIYYSNPAGNAVKIQACISFTGANDDIEYVDLDPNSTSYTFPLNETGGHDILRAGTTSGKQYRFVTFFVTTWINDKAYYSTLQRTYTVLDCEPELNPTVEDRGDASYELTKDRSKIIRYFNYPKAIFNATAKKGASIVSKTVTCGSQTKTAEGDYAQFNNVDSNVFTFSVTDNRGITVSKDVTVDMVPYVNLTCNVKIDTELGSDTSDSKAHLTVQGNWYSGSFGAVGNTLIVEYRYKTNTEDYPSEWTKAIVSDVTDGVYTANETVTGLDYTKTYTFQARARDAIYTWGVQAKDEIIKIIPVFDWGENDFNFNVPVHGKGGFTYDIPIHHSNVDNMLTSGIYYMGTSASNKPGGYNGWLEVYTPVDGGSYSYQKFINYLGDKYERWRIDGVWGTWKSLTIKTTAVNVHNYTLNWTKSNSGMHYAIVSSLTSLGLSDHTILGIYVGNWGGFSATSLINPYIQNGELRIMATAPTTPSEYTLIISYQ